jgi:cell division control protein 6
VVDAQDIKAMAAGAERENALFADKGALDGLAPMNGRQAPVGRREEASELVRALAVSKGGYIAPFVFVYGRAGSGKSTVVKFVCDNLLLDYRMVNLRRGRTVFECAGLILRALGRSPDDYVQGWPAADRIASAVEAISGESRWPFALVLDEFDALLHDSRGQPSDFVYKLVNALQRLREKGIPACIVAITNDAGAAESLDDRVRSRIGAAPEVFFGAYSKEDLVAILKDRAAAAFSVPIISDGVIDHIAEKSSAEHGDARRAIDLLWMAAESAGAAGGKGVEKSHVDAAAERLQKDRVAQAMARAPHHMRMVLGGLIRASYLAPEELGYSIPSLYDQYILIAGYSKVKPLTYRRVAEMLFELENIGVAKSQVLPRGRLYRLTAPVQVVGAACMAGFWVRVQEQRAEYDRREEELRQRVTDASLHEYVRNGARLELARSKERWRDFVGL